MWGEDGITGLELHSVSRDTRKEGNTSLFFSLFLLTTDFCVLPLAYCVYIQGNASGFKHWSLCIHTRITIGKQLWGIV